MKNLLKSTAAMALALSMSAPMALAQPAPPGPPPHPNHPTTPNHPDTTKVHDSGNHDKVVNKDVVNHDKTVVNHETVVHNPSPWAPNGFVQGHTPGDNRLPIYTQSGIQHQSYEGGYGGARQWHRGDRYDGPREVVTNWDAYHVNRPPAGYEYVRNGNQLVLIAIASGVVADVLANALAQ